MTKKENHYLKVADFNRAYVLHKVSQLLKREGATIINHFNSETIVNIRSYSVGHGMCDISEEQNERLKKLYNYTFKTIYEYSLEFILNGFLYHFSCDDNPFFDGIYSKIKLNDDLLTYYGRRLCESTANKKFGYALTSCGMGDECFKAHSRRSLNKIAKTFLENYFRPYIINSSESPKDSKITRSHYGNITITKREFDNQLIKVYRYK